jgi:hypothetical protein
MNAVEHALGRSRVLPVVAIAVGRTRTGFHVGPSIDGLEVLDRVVAGTRSGPD